MRSFKNAFGRLQPAPILSDQRRDPVQIQPPGIREMRKLVKCRTLRARMAQHRIRRLPVCREDSVVGILSVSDLARRADTGFEAAMAIAEISMPEEK